MENSAAPPVLMARLSSGVRRSIPTKPATKSDRSAAYRYDPMEVKSFLVVSAKAVRAMTTAEVMPRASRTMSVLYLIRGMEGFEMHEEHEVGVMMEAGWWRGYEVMHPPACRRYPADVESHREVAAPTRTPSPIVKTAIRMTFFGN